MALEKIPADVPKFRISLDELQNKSREQIFDKILESAGMQNLSEQAKASFKNDKAAYTELVNMANNGVGYDVRGGQIDPKLIKLYENEFEARAQRNIEASLEAEKVDEVVNDVPSESINHDDEVVVDEDAEEEITPLVDDSAAIRSVSLVSVDPATPVRPTRKAEPSDAIAVGPDATGSQESRKGWRSKLSLKFGTLVVTAGALTAAIHGESHSGAPSVQAEAAHSAEANPNVNLMDQESDFFKDAVDIHKLPGTIGNNFGPSVSEQDTRIDTPEAREKTIALFEQMLKGNTDILTAYMYEFGQLGPKLGDKAWGDQAQGSDVLQRMRDAAAHLGDPKNIAEHFKAVESVMDVIKTIGGGDIRRFGPDHKSYFIGPDGKIGIDSDVQDNNAVYRNYVFDLGSGKMLELPILLHCHLQPASAEIQMIIAALRMTPAIAQPFVNSPIAEVPQIIPSTPHVPEQPQGHGGNVPHVPTGGGSTPPTSTPLTPKNIAEFPDSKLPSQIQAGEKTTVDEKKDLQAAAPKKPARQSDGGGPNNFSTHQAAGTTPNSGERASGASQSASASERGSDGSFSGTQAQAGSNPNKSTPAASSSGGSSEGSGGSSSSAGSGGESAGGSSSRNTHTSEN